MIDRWLRIVAPLAALAYPALVWCGPALWAPLLALSLACPAAALAASLRLADREAPVARAIALFAIGAPALFSLLGGLLDWQRAIPLTSVRVWIPLWLALAAIAWVAPARGRAPIAATPGGRRAGGLVLVHALTALPIVAFALAHLANHLTGIVGGDVHGSVMSMLRSVYRHPAVEPALLACVAAQVVTGVVLAGRRLARSTAALDTLQSASGSYLALFFVSHVTAALRARARGVDPNWQWLTSSDLFHDPWSARLAPYYVLGVLALAVHLGCAVRGVAIGHGWTRGATWLISAAAALGALVAAVVMCALALG